MEFNRKIEKSRKLNTKGCCFLCLQFENIKNEELEGSQVLQSISLRQLLRHLQIPTAHSLNRGSLVGYDCKKEDIQVDLCENCGQMISRFSVLFQKLKKIQLEMDHFLERIHRCISQSGKDAERVQNYSKRMTSDLEALSQLAFVDNLRKQVAKQSLNKLNVPRLHLVLTRTDINQFKTEYIEEKCESSDADIPERNDIADDISPPPSPKLTADHLEDVKLIKEPSSAPTFQEKEKLLPSLKPVTKKGMYYTRNPSTGMYECNKCDKKSKSPKTIECHFKIVHLKPRHKCDICNVSVFSYLCKLAFHKKTCLKKLEKKTAEEKDPKFKFIFKTCGKKFDTNLKLREHTRWVHTNANRFQCDLCDKKYTSKATLKDHQAAIHQARKFCCKIGMQ